MSKSVGNVIDPQEILREDGAEALRFWSAIEGDLSRGDFICSKEKIKAEKKTLNKLINISKFVSLFDKVSGANITKLDQLFIDYIEDLTKRTENSFFSYDFNHPAQELRQFLWDVFASHYIELVKNRAYNEEKRFTSDESDSAKYTLHYIHERLLLLLYPIIPQISHFIAKDKGIDLLSSKWVESKEVAYDISLVGKIMDFNSFVWKSKKEKGISLKEKIEGIEIPTELKDFEKDLRAAHGV
jgi:valyl-tRNA synthetase